jgi:hypothetical protein
MVVGRSAAGWLLGLALVACTSEPAQRAAPEPVEPIHVDASGQRYVVRTIDKAQATPFGAGKVRTRNGIDLELAGEDAASWHYKVYLPQERAPKPRAPAPAPPDPPRAADLAASDALQFEPIGAGLPRAGQWREGFDLADLDGDGNLDLVHGPARKGRRVPHVFRGDGRGAFAEWSEARFPSLAYDYGDARAADFDGDGRLDLALAVHLSGLQLLLGDGRGGFRAAGAGLDWSGAGAGFSSRAIRAADLDGDGRVDLAPLGEFPGGTEVIAWRDIKSPQNSFVCGNEPPFFPMIQEQIVAFDDEESAEGLEIPAVPPIPPGVVMPFPGASQKTAVGDEQLPVTFPRGFLVMNLNTTIAGQAINSNDPAAAQSFVTMVHANRKHRMAVRATALDDANNAEHTIIPVP